MIDDEARRLALVAERLRELLQRSCLTVSALAGGHTSAEEALADNERTIRDAREVDAEVARRMSRGL